MTIADGFAALPRIAFEADWQVDMAGRDGITATSLLESFIDVDGEPLQERLIDLTRTAVAVRVPICF
jgi:hypothetical protein